MTKHQTKGYCRNSKDWFTPSARFDGQALALPLIEVRALRSGRSFVLEQVRELRPREVVMQYGLGDEVGSLRHDLPAR
jgi:hypothetical protein